MFHTQFYVQAATRPAIAGSRWCILGGAVDLRPARSERFALTVYRGAAKQEASVASPLLPGRSGVGIAPNYAA